jgi:lipoprotein-anchoring transpeptidase ErfK/SrfK
MTSKGADARLPRRNFLGIQRLAQPKGFAFARLRRMGAGQIARERTGFGMILPSMLRIRAVSIIAATAALGFATASSSWGETATVGLAPSQRVPAPSDAESPLGDALSIEAVNNAEFFDSRASRTSAVVLKAQILLDRAGFSPGAISAGRNDNFRKALAAFQIRQGLGPTGKLDQATWDALVATSAEPVVAEYKITQTDTNGPFAPDIPDEIEDWARLKRLSYRGPRELLAEKFHMDARLLAALNPEAAFEQPGTRILVARVGSPAARAAVTRIEVDKQQRRLRAYDKDGNLVAAFPASVGSAEKPTPKGAFVVRSVARNPVWRYNPRFAFKEIKTNRAFRVAAGPNNPLGTVWIGINKPSYGIHGTPDPEEVGASASHGCVRLTNWDVQTLAKMVKRGTKVEFIE